MYAVKLLNKTSLISTCPPSSRTSYQNQKRMLFAIHYTLMAAIWASQKVQWISLANSLRRTYLTAKANAPLQRWICIWKILPVTQLGMQMIYCTRYSLALKNLTWNMPVSVVSHCQKLPSLWSQTGSDRKKVSDVSIWKIVWWELKDFLSYSMFWPKKSSLILEFITPSHSINIHLKTLEFFRTRTRKTVLIRRRLYATFWASCRELLILASTVTKKLCRIGKDMKTRQRSLWLTLEQATS